MLTVHLAEWCIWHVWRKNFNWTIKVREVKALKHVCWQVWMLFSGDPLIKSPVYWSTCAATAINMSSEMQANWKALIRVLQSILSWKVSLAAYNLLLSYSVLFSCCIAKILISIQWQGSLSSRLFNVDSFLWSYWAQVIVWGESVTKVLEKVWQQLFLSIQDWLPLCPPSPKQTHVSL